MRKRTKVRMGGGKNGAMLLASNHARLHKVRDLCCEPWRKLREEVIVRGRSLVRLEMGMGGTLRDKHQR